MWCSGYRLKSVLRRTAIAFPDPFHTRIMPDGEADEFVVVGDKQYVKSSDMSRNMIIAFSRSATSMLSKEATPEIIDSLTDIQTLPEEKAKGVESYHYKDRIDMEQVIEKEKADLAEMKSRMEPDDYDRMLKSLESSLAVNTVDR